MLSTSPINSYPQQSFYRASQAMENGNLSLAGCSSGCTMDGKYMVLLASFCLVQSWATLYGVSVILV